MNPQDSESLNKIRQQFDFGPYPRISIETSPKQFPGLLYSNNIGTSYYRRNRTVLAPSEKTILDVGCGTGYTSLVLAEANPGAKIIGIDISKKSIELAKKRLIYHGFKEAKFYQLSIEESPSLELDFDYINCDEVLYLTPDPVRTLKTLKRLLKSNGILRTNLHNSAQRHLYYNAQNLFKIMGILTQNPEDTEIGIVREFMDSLREDTILKERTWRAVIRSQQQEQQEESILANYLLQGDRGFTMTEVFRLLEEAELEFIDMVDWRQWNFMNLFKEPDNLPIFLALALSTATDEEALTMFNLLHPIHRLIDFWCGHPGQGQSFTPIEEWTHKDWQTCTVHITPLLQNSQVKKELSDCLNQNQVFPLSKILPIAGVPAVGADVTVAAALFLPLLEAPQTVYALLQRWKKIRPLNLETLEPLTDDEALTTLKHILTSFEDLGYILLEHRV